MLRFHHVRVLGRIQIKRPLDYFPASHFSIKATYQSICLSTAPPLPIIYVIEKIYRIKRQIANHELHKDFIRRKGPCRHHSAGRCRRTIICRRKRSRSALAYEDRSGRRPPICPRFSWRSTSIGVLLGHKVRLDPWHWRRARRRNKRV